MRVPLPALRCISQIPSYLKGKNSTIDDVMIAYLFEVEWVGIYKEKLWLLSLLDSDTVSLPLGEEFPFPYHGPTVKG